MSALPLLQDGNVVVYASDADLRASAEAHLTKGSLAVQPEVPLEALSTIEVKLMAPRLTAPLLLRCEVVVLQPERALLRILEPDLDTFAPLLLDTTLSPVLEGGTLRFASEDDLNAAGRDLYRLGAVMASSAEMPLPGERRALTLQVGERRAETPLSVSLQPGPGGMIVVELERKEQLARVLPEVMPLKAPPDVVLEREEASEAHPPPPDDGDSPSTRRASVALQLAPSGPLRNPTTAEGVLRLSLMRPLTKDDLARPSTHLLLRWLLSTRGSVRVELEMAGNAVHPFVVTNGREVRSAVSMPTLGRNLVEAEGRYVTVELQRPPRLTHSGTMLQLLQEVLSGLVAKLSDEELERGLDIHGGRNPLLNDVGQRLLEGFGFSSSHKRLALKALSGRESVYDVTCHAAGARSAFEVLYTLEVSGGLDWVDGERAEREERQRREKERLDRLVEGAAGFWQKIEHANHFEAMGLHWSTPPRKIQPAYRELERVYGPNGEARKTAPDVCDLIWRKVSDAYAVLSDTTRRRAHRKDAYALKWSAQIDVLLDRADIAMYRKAYEEAADLLSICEDIHPTTAAAERLAKLRALSAPPAARR